METAATDVPGAVLQLGSKQIAEATVDRWRRAVESSGDAQCIDRLACGVSVISSPGNCAHPPLLRCSATRAFANGCNLRAGSPAHANPSS